MDLTKIPIYRIIAFPNLEYDITNGLFCKNRGVINPSYINIGNKEVIDRRSSSVVKCFDSTVVNDYVPFYFSVRTPMLYNIHTGRGVPQYHQKDIVYLCCKLHELATDEFQWCYTDGNAAMKITNFFTDIENISTNIDWRSIESTDFKANNADGDEDRIRKKHAEFLVKDHVPPDLIKAIVVYNEEKRVQVQNLLDRLGIKAKVVINPGNKYYF